MLAERHGIPLDRAFELMRQHARSERTKLDEVAPAVFNRRHTFAP